MIFGGSNLIANELTVPEGSILSPMLRSTHFVSDIDESLKLYRDILGLQIRTDSFAKPGDSALVFITSDIFGVYEKVKSNNYLIASSPMILFPKDNSVEQDYEMLFFDHDGIGINLIQRSLVLD